MRKQKRGARTEADEAVTSFFSAGARTRYPPVLTGPNGRPMHPGAVIDQRVRCGKAGCRCAGGDLHGPYQSLFWRSGGHLRKAYLRPAEVAPARAACEEWRQFQARRLRQRRETIGMFRQMRQMLRDMKADGEEGKK